MAKQKSAVIATAEQIEAAAQQAAARLREIDAELVEIDKQFADLDKQTAECEKQATEVAEAQSKVEQSREALTERQSVLQDEVAVLSGEAPAKKKRGRKKGSKGSGRKASRAGATNEEGTRVPLWQFIMKALPTPKSGKSIDTAEIIAAVSGEYSFKDGADSEGAKQQVATTLNTLINKDGLVQRPERGRFVLTDKGMELRKDL